MSKGTANIVVELHGHTKLSSFTTEECFQPSVSVYLHDNLYDDLEINSNYLGVDQRQLVKALLAFELNPPDKIYSFPLVQCGPATLAQGPGCVSL